MSQTAVHMLCLRAKAAIEAGAFGDAEPLIEQALALDSGCVTALLHRAETRLAREDWSGALATVDAASAIAPMTEWHHRIRAVALDNLGRIEGALAETQAAIALHPEAANAHYLAGRFLIRLGRLPEALASVTRARDLDPEQPLYWCVLAELLCDANRLAEAETAFRHCLSLDTDHTEAHAGLATLLDATGRHRDALAFYREALTLDASLEGTRADLRMAEQRVDAPKKRGTGVFVAACTVLALAHTGAAAAVLLLPWVTAQVISWSLIACSAALWAYAAVRSSRASSDSRA